MITSRVTAKGQVTLPKEICERLNVRPGDTVTYELQPEGAVTMRKTRAFDWEWHRTLSNTLAEEWNSLEHEPAFRDL